jgi:hypothetical protein
MTTTSVTHTPAPWLAEHFIVRAQDKFIVARTNATGDAEFIVRACNAYDDLLAALKECLEQLTAYQERGWLGDAWRTRVGLLDDISCARAAIAKAEGR